MLTLLLTLLLADATPLGPELITNPGFETPVAGTGAAGWSGLAPRDWGDPSGQMARDGEVRRSGAASIRIERVRQRFAVANSAAAVQVGRAYRLSGWLRSDLTRGERAFLAVAWSGATGWLATDETRAISARRDWVYIERVFAPDELPQGVVSASVSFRVESDSGVGQAWADDLSFREVTLPAAPSRAALESQRQVDLARILLGERLVWEDRLATLRLRRAALQKLLAGGETAPRQPDPALWPAPRPRAELLRDAPAEPAAVRAALASLADLPELREQCLAELEALLGLKRALDNRPAQRRHYLLSQLAALGPRPQRAAAPSAPLPAELSAPPARCDGSLQGLRARVSWRDGWRLEIRGELPATPGARLLGSLLAADDQVAHAASLALGGPTVNWEWPALAVRAWFPDCPYLYRLRLALVTSAGVADYVELPIAFREIRVDETDLSATMRHAWDWAPTDYTFTVNGQPWFPRGTVCNDLARHPDETLALADELWLEFFRSYGNSLGQLGGELASKLAAAGKGFTTSFAPEYRSLRRYESRSQGFDAYREIAASLAPLLDHPALWSLQVGNEAELEVWGANLSASYGEDLWQVVEEAAAVVRQETDPRVPLAYVRAADFDEVMPAPAEDYAGVNQYTGRYWGTRRTIGADLAALAWAAGAEHKPIGITEWNGPKYSWATGGISGVDEQGSAQYLYDYWREMTRTPAMVLSTEFVLNWVVTPVEDLTSVPLSEGLKRRAGWQWSLQQGTPWYPRIFPDLLTDTPARRTLQGIQSPLYELTDSPGPLQVVAAEEQRAAASRLAEAVRALGREVAVGPLPGSIVETDANLLLVGGLGGAQPAAVRELEALGVLGVTDATWPRPGGHLIQRRLHPGYPDRFLLAVTAADAAGMEGAVARLETSAASLRAARQRREAAPRAIALVDDEADTRQVFERYVLDLVGRGSFVARDDVRTRWTSDDLVGEIGLLVVASRRALEPAELELLCGLPARGTVVVWSAATLAANPALAERLGVGLGATHRLTDSIPVAPWASQPLAVPQMGEVITAPLEKFGRLKPEGELFGRAVTVRELDLAAGWEPAATRDGKAVVARRREGTGAHWVFGVDLAGAARALWSTTHGGVNHTLYDRETASGLERVFRLVTNAGAREPRLQPARAGLRAELRLDRLSLEPNQPLGVEVLVRDATGAPATAQVRLGLSSLEGGSYRAIPTTWRLAPPVGAGRYRLEIAPGDLPTPGPSAYRESRMLGVLASVEQPGWAGDWVSRTVRLGRASNEASRLAELRRRIEQRLVGLPLSFQDRAQFVEVEGELLTPVELKAGQMANLELVFKAIESETGNDYLEQTTLVLTPPAGAAVEVPIVPGKIIASPNTALRRTRAAELATVTAAQPLRVPLAWTPPRAGTWQLSLRYRYTDEFRGQAAYQLPRDDAIGAIEVAP